MNSVHSQACFELWDKDCGTSRRLRVSGAAQLFFGQNPPSLNSGLLKARLKLFLKVLIRLLKARLKVLLKVLIRLLKARLKFLLKSLIRLLKRRAG